MPVQRFNVRAAATLIVLASPLAHPIARSPLRVPTLTVKLKNHDQETAHRPGTLNRPQSRTTLHGATYAVVVHPLASYRNGAVVL